jgi:hypothetical protein
VRRSIELIGDVEELADGAVGRVLASDQIVANKAKSQDEDQDPGSELVAALLPSVRLGDG